MLPDTTVLIASSPPCFPHISGRMLVTLRRTPLAWEVRDSLANRCPGTPPCCVAHVALNRRTAVIEAAVADRSGETMLARGLDAFMGHLSDGADDGTVSVRLAVTPLQDGRAAGGDEFVATACFDV